MSSAHVRTFVPALALVFVLGACSDDGPTATGDQLTQEQAEQMMEAYHEATDNAIVIMGSPPAAGDVAAFTITVDETEPCAAGGTVHMQGSVAFDETEDGGTMDVDVTWTPQDCRGTDSQGSVWTFNGDPSVTVDFFITFTEESFSMTGTQSGGLAWSSGNLSGTCQINLNYDVSSTETAASVSISGTVCGHSISIEETIDFNDFD